MGNTTAKNPLLGGSKSSNSPKIEWWVDPDSGKTIVSIPHCADPCKLLELGKAICEACYVDAAGEPISDFKIEIIDGKLRIPCNTTDFEICTAIINGVECPEKLIITPCGGEPLPPVWLQPVRSINGVQPGKDGDIKITDCCAYHTATNTVLDPASPPATPPGVPAGDDKSPGDTAIVNHPNGMCYYTCGASGWVLDYCKVDPADCCHYQEISTAILVPGSPPAVPAVTLGDDKSDGDTLHVDHPNGACYYTCAGGVWTLDFCNVGTDCCHYQEQSNTTLVPGQPPATPAVTIAGDKSDGDTLHVSHANGECYYTCVAGAWVLDFCKVDPADCCTYIAVSTAVVDPAAPPAAPTVNTGDDKSNGDTLVVGHPNGTCYYTCTGGAWVLDFCKVDPADCCTYHAVSEAPVDPESPPAAPAVDPAEDKSDGDTLQVGHPNATCYYTCVDGAWVLDFCKVDPADCCHYQATTTTLIDPEAPPEPPADLGGDDKSDGDTAHVSHPNGSCYYTCVDGTWVLDFCKIKDADCCHYVLSSEAVIEPESPPAIPSDPAGEAKSDGDTATVGFANGWCAYVCSGGAWVNQFCQVDKPDCCHYHVTSEENIDLAEPPAALPEGTAGDDLSEGDTAHVQHGNADCYYTYTDGAWVLDFCQERKVCASDVAELAEEARCHYDDPGLVSGQQVDAFIDQNLEFDSSGFTASNPCCNTVQGSNNGTVDNCSQSSQSNNSTATGVRSSAISANAGTNTGNYAIVSGAGAVNSGNNSFVTGASNDSSGANSIVTGANNDNDGIQNLITGSNHFVESGLNVVGGNTNTVTGNGRNLYVGTGNTGATTANINNVVGGRNNTVEGGANTITGADNTVVNTSQGNTVSGLTNVLDSSNFNTVAGSDNSLTSNSSSNTVSGQVNALVESIYNSVSGSFHVLTDALRNVITGTGATVTNSGDSVIAGRNNLADTASSGFLNGWRNCLIGTNYSSVFDSADSENNGTVGATVLASRGVLNAQSFVVTGGAGPIGAVKTSSNRTWQLNSVTGNLFLSGAVNTGFAFPDFGEYAVVDREIEAGLLLKYTGTHKAEIADEGTVFDGVSRPEIPMAAGGGIDPANSKWLLDDMGNRIPEIQDIEAVRLVVDKEATAKAQAEADAKVDESNKEAQAVVDEYNKAEQAAVEERNAIDKAFAEENELPFFADEFEPLADAPVTPYHKVGPVEVEETYSVSEEGFKLNPDYDAATETALKTVGVSMLGRVWVQTQGRVSVGDYLAVGNNGKGVASKEKTCARVLEVSDDRAFVVLK